MITARRSRTAILITVLGGTLALAGCEVGTGPGVTSDRAAEVAVKNTSNARASGAARHLPDFSAATFPIEDVDLAAKPDPMRTAAGLLKAAIGTAGSPRFEVKGVEASTTDAQVQKTIALTTSALSCLHQKGAQELHAYHDTLHRYSMAIAMVVKAQAYRRLDPAWCAVSSVIPYTDAPESSSPPTIAPCVGQRREGAALVLWVATSDAFCAALGDPVAPVDRNLARGDSGTDVARLQLALNDLGSTLRVDGRLGTATIRQIRAFEACYSPGERRPAVADAGTLADLTAAQTSGWSAELCRP